MKFFYIVYMNFMHHMTNTADKIKKIRYKVEKFFICITVGFDFQMYYFIEKVTVEMDVLKLKFEIMINFYIF